MLMMVVSIIIVIMPIVMGVLGEGYRQESGAKKEMQQAKARHCRMNSRRPAQARSGLARHAKAVADPR
jgi:hypothetical protein